MSKQIIEDNFPYRRKTSFTTPYKANRFNEEVKLPPVPFSQARTLKRFKNQNLEIPTLNFDNQSTEKTQESEAFPPTTKFTCSERPGCNLPLEDISFTLKQCKVKKANKKECEEGMISNYIENVKLPKIQQRKMSLNEKWEEANISRGKVKNEKKRQKKLQCKVLLSKKSPFPFTTQLAHKKRKIYLDERELLDVSDISQISFIQEDEHFINQESLQELSIF